MLARTLAAQQSHPGADTVDPAVVDRLAAGEPVDQASDWECAIAAVVAIDRGATRGQAARRLGEDSPDVSHWYRRHLEGMALIEPRRDGSPEGTIRTPSRQPTQPEAAR